MVVYAAIMSSESHIAVPDRSFGKMARAFPHCGAIRSLIDFGTQSNGRGREGAERTVFIVQAAGHSGIAGTPCRPVHGVLHLRRQNCCRTASDSSSFQITARHEIGRQPFTGAEHICHLTAKSRRNIGCVLAHISFKDICSPNHRHRLDAGGLTKAACRSIGFCVLKS